MMWALTFDFFVDSGTGAPNVESCYFRRLLHEMKWLHTTQRPREVEWGSFLNRLLVDDDCRDKSLDEAQDEEAAPMVEDALECMKLCWPTHLWIRSDWQGERLMKALPQLETLQYVHIKESCLYWTCGYNKRSRIDCRKIYPSLQACPSLRQLKVVVPDTETVAALESLYDLVQKNSFCELLINHTVQVLKSENGRIDIEICRESSDVGLAGVISNTCLAVKPPLVVSRLALLGVQEEVSTLSSGASLEGLSIGVGALSNVLEKGICPGSCLEKVSLVFQWRAPPVFELLNVLLREQEHLVELNIEVHAGVNLNEQEQMQRIPAFAEALQRHSCLRCLGFTTCANAVLHQSCVRALFAALGQSSSLETVRFCDQMRLDMDGIIKGFGKLEHNSRLQSLLLGTVVSLPNRKHDAQMEEARMALEGNLSISDICSSFGNWRCFGFGPLLCRNELLGWAWTAKDRAQHNKVQLGGGALLPHMLSKLGSNTGGEGTPLYSFLRENGGGIVTLPNILASKKRKATSPLTQKRKASSKQRLAAVTVQGGGLRSTSGAMLR